MSNYLQLQAQIEKLQQEAEQARKRELNETIANIKQAIAAFGLTAEDLGLASPSGKRGRKSAAKAKTARRGRPAKAGRGAAVPAKKRGVKATRASKSGKKTNGTDKRSVVAPKYRDSTSGATWTGRGKQPKWLASALASGKKLDDFRI